MTKIISIALLSISFIIKSCGGSIIPPAPLPTSPSMDPSKWSLLWGTGTPASPSQATMGWHFTMPLTPGSVHYVQTPMGALNQGQSIIATFKITQANAKFSALVEPGEADPPQIHIFIEKNNVDWNDQYGRWWCTYGHVISTENQFVTINCPLNPNNWISVYGQKNFLAFDTALHENGAVGITFGGANGYGHGVTLTQGTAAFEMVSFYVK